MTLKEFKQVLENKPSYRKKGKQWLADYFNISIEIVNQAFGQFNKDVENAPVSGSKTKKQVFTYLNKIKESNPGLKLEKTEVQTSKSKIVPFKKGDPDNVLFIGDLHAPFVLDGYLEFNIELQKKYNCGTIIFAGDIIDAHSWSFHTADVDGMSVKDELQAAITQLGDWYKAFPEATILYGNHDLRIARKAKEYGLSQLFLKYFGDIISAPKEWNFTHEFYKDDVLYIHGSNGNAIKRATEIRHSVAQGHLHSEAFVSWSVSEIDSIFGLQVGCGIDRKQYAFQYAETMTKKPIVSSGVILNKGTLPIIHLMEL